MSGDAGRGRRVALVTGASSGIGRGLALRLAADGWSVALVARRGDLLEEVAHEVRSAGAEARVCVCDIALQDEVVHTVDSVRSTWGPVDLLVANAGVSERTPAHRLDAAQVERIMRVNFLGCVYATEAVLGEMIARRAGHLVAVGSLAGYGGLPSTAAYSASKGALHNFFESLRIDLRGSGVAVTVLTPGYVRTAITGQIAHRRPFLVELDPAVDRMYRAIRDRKPLLTFPRPLSSLAWWAQVFPAGLYDRLVGRVPRTGKEKR